MKRKWYSKWGIWLIVSVTFLAFIQTIFHVPAPCKWLEHVWEAGDIISFVGTMVLGYIAIYQTANANEMAKEANRIAKQASKTSQDLIQLQKMEYYPVVRVTKFLGICDYKLKGEGVFNTSLAMAELKTKDDEIVVEYLACLLVPGATGKNTAFQRFYEIHFKYNSKAIVHKVVICSVEFVGVNFYQRFNLESEMELSLYDEDEFKIFLCVAGDSDFNDINSETNKYIKAPKMGIALEMTTIDGEKHLETIVIFKHAVKEGTPSIQYGDHPKICVNLRCGVD